MEIVGEGGNGQEAIRLAGELAPDVVLMDLEMPILGGLEATRWIKAFWPAVALVLVGIAAGAGAGGYAYLRFVKGGAPSTEGRSAAKGEPRQPAPASPSRPAPAERARICEG